MKTKYIAIPTRLGRQWSQIPRPQATALAKSTAALLAGVALLALPFAAPAAAKDPVVVLTGYHDDVVSPVVKAFEAAHPDIQVELVWKQGREAFDALAKPGQGGVDVFWAPALGSFPALRELGAFQPIAVDRAALPGRIGKQPVSDPNGYFEAYEVAGYGLAVNAAKLNALGLAQPKAWRDLADPRFAGQIGLPVPGQVGFAPALYDVILQSEGWEKGWALISEIAGNGKLLEFGGSPTADVASGDIAAGLTIDFYPLSAAAGGDPLAFIYPARTAFLPAHVAVTASAPHTATAAAFVQFLLSREGQEVLLRPDVRRHPIRPDAYGKAPAGFGNPFAPDDITFAYDSELGRLRRGVIATLFQTAIASRHDKVVALWRAIHDAEAKLAAKPDPARSALLQEARRLAGSIPLSAEAARDPARLAQIKAYPDDIAAVWKAELDAAEARALALARRAGAAD
jgi:ABC-type Fe3+ transport system substrate-binding protein